MKHSPLHDEVILWKSTNVDLGNDRYMLVVYYYHTDRENKANAFYKCNIRIDKKENWMKLREDLLKVNPAEYFKNSMIGIDDDYRVFYSRHTFNKADMYKWIGTKFSPKKIQTIENFLTEEFAPNITSPYLRKYIVNGSEVDISEVDKIPEGQWFSSYREKKPRKKYGNIIQ